MDYGKYKNARNAAWQCILDYDIKTLPIEVTNIVRKSNDINLVKNSDVNILQNNASGVTIVNNNSFIIVYRDTDSSRRCRFTIAHELGHILLGHMLVDKIAYRTFAVQNDTESAANVFARDLLAPACVLHELKALTAEEISRLCNISLEAATYRANRMHELEKRNAFYKHPLEREVVKQFIEFINKKKSQSQVEL